MLHKLKSSSRSHVKFMRTRAIVYTFVLYFLLLQVIFAIAQNQ